ncbi:hypothetical protein CDL15_Pgr011110 [Punica granatum]|uniref:SPARK domain-containing protein n=1 Tax=Punica granatum TaxID=22663 RepID=A0A218XNP6_PUNGR|nr:hypothetical protein CDL15_Pgr011110 [Punica granatum]
MLAYLRRSGAFLPPPASSQSCWSTYKSIIGFKIRSSCGFPTEWISENGCHDIATQHEFESLVPDVQLSSVRAKCDQQLRNSTVCNSCRSVVFSLSRALVEEEYNKTFSHGLSGHRNCVCSSSCKSRRPD